MAKKSEIRPERLTIAKLLFHDVPTTPTSLISEKQKTKKYHHDFYQQQNQMLYMHKQRAVTRNSE